MRQISARTRTAYGHQAADLIHLSALAYRGWLGLLGLEGEVLQRALGTAQEAIYKHAPGYILDEIEEVAIGAQIQVGEVVLLNARSEMLSLWSNWRASECTSVAVQAAYSSDGVARVAQNWDWLTVMRSLPVVLASRPYRGPAYTTFCEAGQLAKIGVNEAGLAVGVNFLDVPPAEVDLARGGLPMHVLVRVALAERTVEDALERLRGLPRGGAVNLAFADATGAACCAEVRPSRVDVLFARGGLATHANNFEHGGEKPGRSQRLSAILDIPISRADLLEALRDHDALVEPICSHPVAMLSTSTIASVVLDTRKPALWVAHGTPCERVAPVRYEVPSRV